MSHTKTEWRGVLLGARRALSPALRRSLGASIAERVRALPAFAVCRALLAYEPFGAEVDPTAVCRDAHRIGKPVYVPAVDAEPRWSAWSPDALQPRAALPASSLPDAIPVLVLVPGVAFDPSGTRLGRGLGFYDRALAGLRAERPVIAVGLAFEAQVVAELPTDSWDQPVDLIVTEAQVLAARGKTLAAAGLLAPAGRDVEEVSNS